MTWHSNDKNFELSTYLQELAAESSQTPCSGSNSMENSHGGIARMNCAICNVDVLEQNDVYYLKFDKGPVVCFTCASPKKGDQRGHRAKIETMGDYKIVYQRRVKR